MKEFSFSVPQNIIVGIGSLSKLPELAQKLHGTHAFIISGPSLMRHGVVQQANDILEGNQIKVDAYTDIEANPSVTTVEKATKAFIDSKADFIIALGGGSPMDVAKAVAVVAKYGGSITDYEGGHKVPGEVVPMIAIPTTAGTGSEVTAFAVITDHSRNYKFAGIAFSFARLGDVHAMSHPISAFFDVPHGIANAVLLPVIVQYNAISDSGKYLKIYNYISRLPISDMDFEPMMLVLALRKLCKEIGIPDGITQAVQSVAKNKDVKEEEIIEKIPMMSADAMKSGNILVNPRSTTQKEVEELYYKAL